MHTSHDIQLQSVGSHLWKKFYSHTSERDRYKIINSFRRSFLRNQGDIWIVDVLQINRPLMKSRSQLIEILTDYGPTLFEKQPIKAIWPRGLVNGHALNSIIHLLLGEHLSQGIKALHSVQDWGEIKRHFNTMTSAHPVFEILPESSSHLLMIRNNCTIFQPQRSNGVMPISFKSQSMKKLVFSSPTLIDLIVHLFFQYRNWRCSRCSKCNLTRLRKLNSCL